MNKQLLTRLDSIGLEQLGGIAIGSTFLCVCWLIMMWVARRKSASVQSGVWQATCSAIVMTAFVLFAIPGIPLQSESIRSLPERQNGDPTSFPDLTALGETAQQFHPSLSPVPEYTSADAGPIAEHDPIEIEVDVVHHDNVVGEAPVASLDVVPTAKSAMSLPAVLAALWLAVVLLLLITSIRSTMICRTIIAGADNQVSTTIEDAAVSACELLETRRCPRLVVTQNCQVPFTTGLFRPVIVLPQEAGEWPTDKLTMVIAHELTHVERRDLLWHWIGRMAVCLAWFNPLVWFAAKRGQLDRERACDDRVVSLGFPGIQYGQCLVEVAAALSERSLPIATAVSMAEPPVKQRLQSILSPTTDRRRESVHARTLLLVGFFCLAIVLGIVRPLTTAAVANVPQRQTQPAVEDRRETGPKSQQVVKNATKNIDNNRDPQDSNQDADDDLIELTQPVTGIITDEDGTPIEGAQVLMKLMDFGGGTSQTFRMITVGSWQTTTDESGRYAVDINKIGMQPSRYEIGVETVDKPGFIQGHSDWPSLKEVAAGKQIGTIKLSRGRRVAGQLVAANGEPASAAVRAFGKTQSGEHWRSSGLKVGDDGILEIDLPIDSQIGLEVYPENHSPMFVSVMPNQSDLGEIQLSRGSIVTGSVVDRQGNSVEGVVVVLDSVYDRQQETLTRWSRATVSDDKGTFRLPPAAGDCRLYVQESVLAPNGSDGYESLTGTRPPLIMPVELSLSAEQDDQQVILKEAESCRVSGTARWDDGKPAGNVELVGGVAVGKLGINLATALTDAKGHYEFWLPQNSHVYVSGTAGAYRDGSRDVWYKATNRATAGSSQTFSIKTLAGDTQDVDWDLRPYRVAPTRTKAEIEAETEFAELFGNQREARSVTPTKALAFEEKYRGEKEALRSVSRILRDGKREPQTEIVVVERLIDHYLGHEGLADTFSHLKPGPYDPDIPRADDLLRLASGRSPHPTVRAAALLTRAERAQEQLRSLELLPQIEAYVAVLKDESAWLPAGDTAKNKRSTATAESMQRRLNALKAIDPDELRIRAIRWLQTIEQDYRDLIRPRIVPERTFGQAAKALRFALERVIVGRPAPPFEAVDIRARPFSLFEHLGEVVVITFYNGAIDPVPHKQFQSLAERFNGQPFQLVTIVASDSREEFVETARTMKNPGVVIWEPYRGPFYSNWGVSSQSTTFVVGRSGKLRSVTGLGIPVSAFISELLQEEFHDEAMQLYRLAPGGKRPQSGTTVPARTDGVLSPESAASGRIDAGWAGNNGLSLEERSTGITPQVLRPS